MRYGICCSPEDAPRFVEAGFDYVELPAVQLPGRVSGLRGLPAEATNVFFPGTMRLYGTGSVSFLDHAKTVIGCAAELGASLMVLGSGTARTAEGIQVAEAERRFVEIAAELDEISQGFGIRICPESLGREETNVGRDLGALAAALKAKGVGFTADSYHILCEWRDREREGMGAEGRELGAPGPGVWAEQIPFAPLHVHMATLPRILPPQGDPLVAGFFARLRELGYDGRISFEGSLEGVAPSEALARIRSL